MAPPRTIDRDMVAQLAREGKRLSEIARTLGHSVPGIQSVAFDLGFRRRERGQLYKPGEEPNVKEQAERIPGVLYVFPPPDAQISEWAKPLSGRCTSPRSTAYQTGFEPEKSAGGRNALIAQRAFPALMRGA